MTRSVLRSAVAGALLCLFTGTTASAQQPCGQFSLLPTGAVDLFNEFTAAFKSGDGVPLIGVFSFALRPRGEVVYPVRTQNLNGGAHGGIITVEYVAAGRYRIALSGEARVQAVQLWRALPLTEVAPDPACPGEVRRIEVNAEDGPLTLQIDDAHAPLMTIAVYRP